MNTSDYCGAGWSSWRLPRARHVTGDEHTRTFVLECVRR